MEGVTIFRQAMVGGFRKEDVIEYIENLEAEKENLKLALDDSTLKLKEAMEKIEEDKKIAETAADGSDIAALKDDLRKARMAEIDLKQQIRRLEMQNAELSKKAASPSQTDTDYNSRFLKLQTDARTVIANQKKESEAIVEKLKEHVMELFQQSKEKQKESEQAAAVQARKARELEQALRGSEAKVQELEQALRGRDTEVQELEQALRGRDAEVQELEQALRSSEAKVQELEEQLAEQSEELQRSFSEVDGLNAQLKERSARISELKSDISEKDHILENLNQELESRSTPVIPKEQPEPKRETEPDFVREREPRAEQEYSYEASEKKQPVRRGAGDSLEAALNDIFSDAETALSDSEKDAQSKLKFIHS